MADICSVTSSPSLYSHAPSQIGHGHGHEHAYPYAKPSQSRISAKRMTQRWDRKVEADDHGDSESEYGDAASTQNRISMVSGPRVTKYADLPWEDFAETGLAKGSSGNLGKMLRAATRGNGTYSDRSRPSSPVQSYGTLSTETTRKGLAIFGGAKGKQIMSSSSSSGVSLASTQTVSTASSDDRANPVTPRLKPAFGSSPLTNRTEFLAMGRGYDETDTMRRDLYEVDQFDRPPRKLEPSPLPAHASPQLRIPDRPLLSSGSPGFGLISLEAAQERERQRSRPRTSSAQVQLGQPAPRPIPLPSVPSTERGYQIHRSPSEAAAPLGSAPKSVKQKKSIMKLFKHDKTGSNAGFSIVTPALPSVWKLPGSDMSAMPIRSQPVRGNSDGGGGRLLRAGGSVWSYASESAVWPSRSPQASATGNDSADNVLLKPRLELRPISMNFSNGLPSSYLSEVTSTAILTSSPPGSTPLAPVEQDATVAETIKEQVANARKGWMVQLCELEAQIRELKDALAEAKAVKPGRCEACGCSCGGHAEGGSKEFLRPGDGGGVMNRGRAKTGGARGVFGSGSLYEWE